MQFIEQYGAVMASALISIGSLGVVPYLVEGVILFSIVLLIILTLLINFSKKFYLDGFIFSILAGISMIFGFNYIKGNIVSVLLGVFYFFTVPFIMYMAINRFKNETST